MAKAYRKDDFDYLMGKIEKTDPRVKKYLQEAGYEKWSRCHSPINRGRMMTSNFSESINGVKESPPYIYSVYESGQRYIVNLESGSCNCGRFQIDQISYPHAIAVLNTKYVKDFGPYCSEYYKPTTLVKAYEVLIILMSNKKDWDVSTSVDEEEVLPPIYKRLSGKSKKGRKKKSSETLSLSTNRCRCCRHEWHNRRSCNFFPKEN
ncbi:uncharacterized protein LOC107865235 [Capsicum annuum]|uniref:uncharacterized protein LOC107865235 n=1 Tax=Capsicum annuum TaxID=4072 RepID=UPI0007BF9014|nr:uncharacterized protein LOC107865235 [Capsicum annuum]